MPLPEDFPSGSQVSIGCNYTGRLFSRLENGLTWDGPRPSAVFTCVSGKWVGEPGAWQHLENLTCLQCIQLGTPECQSIIFSHFHYCVAQSVVLVPSTSEPLEAWKGS